MNYPWGLLTAKFTYCSISLMCVCVCTQSTMTYTLWVWGLSSPGKYSESPVTLPLMKDKLLVDTLWLPLYLKQNFGGDEGCGQGQEFLWNGPGIQVQSKINLMVLLSQLLSRQPQQLKLSSKLLANSHHSPCILSYARQIQNLFSSHTNPAR